MSTQPATEILEGIGPLAEAASRRLREQLAGRQISQKVLAMKMGVTPMWLNRRYRGMTALSLDDLYLIERASGISAAYLVTGVNAENRHPDHPNGELCSLCTPRDLNPEPTVSSSAETAEASTSNNVVRLKPRLTSTNDLGKDAEVHAFPAAASFEEVDAK
ncbi:helix-turn-helix domain-containing protein [Brevibacterium aurantiacum]|uniref:helix-turn-helix domain-containing protein n=1 Tax=Brevibacterium aurantiacum TaxID=273384 RepID=UPI003F8DE396